MITFTHTLYKVNDKLVSRHLFDSSTVHQLDRKLTWSITEFDSDHVDASLL